MNRKEIKQKAREKLKGNWGKLALFIIAYMAIIEFFSYTSEYNILVAIIYILLSVPLNYNLVMYFMNITRGKEAKMIDIITKIPDNFVVAWRVTLAIIVEMLVYIVALFLSGIVLSAATIHVIFGNTEIGLPILLGAILTILVVSISAALKSLYYTFAFNVMYDSNKEMKGKEAVKRSRELMTKKRGKYMLFTLSFLGWILLILLVTVTIMNILGVTYSVDLQKNTLESLIISFIPLIGMAFIIPYLQIATVVFYDNLKEENQKVQTTTE